MTESKEATRNQDDALAIIGIGCMFPDAQKSKEFWKNIKSGTDSIKSIPATHWRPDDYHNEDPNSPDKTYAKTGGFLSPYEFNPLEYGISPNAIEATDTTQLFGMVVAQQALIDAGYGPEKDFNRDRVSCVIGVTGTLELVIPLGARLGHPIWKKALKDAGVDPETSKEVVERISESYVGWQENSFPGLLGNVVAGRIANNLNLGGTNCVVDAACASSLSALHLACMELQTGKSDMVITGGFDTFNDIFMYMCFSKTPALSPTGNSKPFDKNADGTILGEGLGAVIIKRLSDAERDGDRVYAVVKGIGSSSDGKGQAIYAPSAKGQCKALKNAYRDSNICPSTIGLVEAHGTGTKVGDAVEITALREVFESSSPEKNWCALGSVKSQIGHTKAAAGAAGIIKAALALHYKVLPPTIKVSDPTTAMVDSPFYINSEAKPWVGNEAHPRRAAVSALGFGGSNFHCILEEYKPETSVVDWDGDVQIIAMSNNNFNDLRSDLANEKLAEKSWSDVRNFAFTSRKTFKPGDNFRLILAIDGKAGLGSKVATVESMFARASVVESWSTPDGSYFSSGKPNLSQKIAFMFPGQGSQRIDMLKGIACAFPEMNQALTKADTIAVGVNGKEFGKLSRSIYPPKSFSNSISVENKKQLQNTAKAQPSIGVVSLGCIKILQRFGIKPDVTAGHSFGELTALHAAGCFSEEVFLEMALLRGKLMNEASGGDAGTMLAVQGSKDDVEAVIKDSKLEIVVANHNAPTQVVISGSNEAIEAIKPLLRRNRLRSIPLPVGAAFHSSIVAGAEKPFYNFTSKTKITSPKIPVYSNQTAVEYPADPVEIAKMLSTHLLNPVSFVDQVTGMNQSGAEVFIEVGPGSVLTGLVKKILGEEKVKALAFDQNQLQDQGLTNLARLISEIAVTGYPVTLTAWDDDYVPVVAEKKKGFTVTLTGANYVKEKKKMPPRPPAERAPVRNPVIGTSVESNLIRASRPSAPLQSGSVQVTSQHTVKKTIVRPATKLTDITNVASNKTGAADIISNNSIHNNAGNRVVGMSKDKTPVENNVVPVMNSAFQMTQKSLLSLQELQKQNADLHRQFLEGQQASQDMFHQIMKKQLDMIAGQPASAFNTVQNQEIAQPSVSVPVAPRITRPVVSHPVQQTTVRHSVNKSVTHPVVEKVLTQVVHQTPVSEAALAHPIASQSASSPVDVDGTNGVNVASPAVFSSGQSSVDGTEVLLSIVAEKTGYPKEMLEMTMNLEGDLGIDSIKRVEIFSALQDALGQSVIQSEELGGFATLEDIAKHIQTTGIDATTSIPNLVSTPVSTPVPTEVGGSTQMSPTEKQAFTNDLLAVIAEKTGYPLEMLEPEMELEADLGIDSIKKVEIFSAIQERFPSSTSASSDRLNSLRIVNEIVDYFAEAVGGSTAVEVSQSAPVVDTQDRQGAGISSSNPDSSDVQTSFFAIVAEKTGYPVEMLSLEMDLESDLGIDSIKRVEIFSALQEQVPATADSSPDELIGFRTLNDVVSFYGNKNKPVADSAVEAVNHKPAVQGELFETAQVAEKKNAEIPESVDRFLVKSVPFLSDSAQQPLKFPTVSTVWVAGCNEKQAQPLLEAFSRKNLKAEFVNVMNAKEIVLPTMLGGVVVLAPNKKMAVNEAQFLLNVFSFSQKIYPLIQESSVEQDSFYITATFNGGHFGLSGLGSATNPYFAGISGFSKTASHEWLEINCKSLDIENTSNMEPVFDQLVEQCLKRGAVEIGITKSDLTTVVVEKTEVIVESQHPLTSEDVIVVTGGARGVTAEVALELADRFKSKLILLGRSPIPDPEPHWLIGVKKEADIKKVIIKNADQKLTLKHVEEKYRQIMSWRDMEANFDRIRQTGAKFVYRSVDVRDMEAVKILLTDLQEDLGSITGFIHGAGVLRDRLFVDKTREQFSDVYDTKILGFESVIRALDVKKLKALVLFSSSTGRYGRKGQVDYAVANEVLNKLAQRHVVDHVNCRVVSVNWGPWDGGMVNISLKKMFESEGIAVIPLVAGAKYLADELTQPLGNQAVEVVIMGPSPASKAAQLKAANPLDKMTRIFERELNLTTHKFLAAHVIGGKPVLPAAIMIEWLGHAALHSNPGLVFHGFDNFKVTKGVILNSTDTINLSAWSAPANEDNGQFRVCAELRSTDSSGKQFVRAKAEIILVELLPKAAKSAIEVVTGVYSGTVAEAYEKHLFHGPELQGIRTVEGCSAEGMTANVGPAPHPSDWMVDPMRGRWLTDPLVVDAAFQLMILWSVELVGVGSLPMGVGSYRQYKNTYPQSGSEIRISVSKGLQGRSVQANIEFLDKRGRLISRIDGYEGVRTKSLVKAFSKNTVNSAESRL